MAYIYSTLTAGVDITFYQDQIQGDIIIPRAILRTISINGGNNTAVSGKNGVGLYTPKDGVVTVVSDEDLELLKKNPHFIQYYEGGFIRYDCSEKETKEKVAADMSKADKSAPMTPEGFEKSDYSSKDQRINKISARKGEQV